MGLICTGFSGEKVCLSNADPYIGFEYWELGKHDFARKDTVLIAGSGDGALQDFLLQTTDRKSAKEIYLALELPEEERRHLEGEIFLRNSSGGTTYGRTVSTKRKQPGPRYEIFISLFIRVIPKLSSGF